MKTVYVVIDTETTGSEPLRGDRIIEIGAVPIYKGRVMKDLAFHALVNPEVVIPGHITGVHGLKNDDLTQAPTMMEIFPRFKDYLGASLIVGHNVAADMTFFDMASKETGLMPLSNKYLDTLELAREVFRNGSFKLGDLAQRLGIVEKPTHRALGDALVTSKVFLELARIMGGLSRLKRYVKDWRG